MESRDWISLGALFVSGLSFWASNEARIAAQSVEREKFQTQTAISMLETVLPNVVRKDDPNAVIYCLFVGTLARAERDLRASPPLYVNEFVGSVVENRMWPADCRSRLEEQLATAPPAATKATVMVNGASQPTTIGKWHAFISSYDATPENCAPPNARQDARDFAALLRGRGFGDRSVSVFRTPNGLYTVTVDAGDDRVLASRISAMIRAVATTSTGRDSFVAGNRELSIDPACSEMQPIGS